MLMISELMPKVQDLQASHKPNSSTAILDYLSHISLKQILPTPPPLNPRRFIVSFHTSLVGATLTDPIFSGVNRHLFGFLR